MALFDDFDEKTEAPTPRRREEARERGQVVRSADLSAAAGLLGAMLVLNFLGPGLLADMIRFTERMLSYAGPDATRPSSMTGLSAVGLYALVRMAGPMCLGLLLIAVVVSMAQVGLIFTVHPLIPSLEKIDPIAGFGRIFSMESVVKLILSVFKVGLIGAVAWYTIRNHIGQILISAELDYLQIMSLAASLIFMLGLRLALVLLIIALFDYALARFKHERGLRMSKQELKEELRRMEGDPMVKERRRRVARQLAIQRMQYAVPKADVVVTNPTELAIALKYDAKTMAAPRVVAKGAGYVAARIRQIALRHQIPIVERKPLARALYKSVEVGQEIPPAFYKAVAEILAYVYELTKKTPAVRQTMPAAAET